MPPTRWLYVYRRKICRDSVYFQGPQQDWNEPVHISEHVGGENYSTLGLFKTPAPLLQDFLTRQHTFEMAKQKRLEAYADGAPDPSLAGNGWLILGGRFERSTPTATVASTRPLRKQADSWHLD